MLFKQSDISPLVNVLKLLGMDSFCKLNLCLFCCFRRIETCSRLQVLMNSCYLLELDRDHTFLSCYEPYRFWQGRVTLEELFVLVLLKEG